MGARMQSMPTAICYNPSELKEKIIDYLVDFCLEEDTIFLTEFTYRLNKTGFTLRIGKRMIICSFKFEQKKFAELLARVYKKYLKLAEMNMIYCLSSVFFEGEKITADLTMIN